MVDKDFPAKLQVDPVSGLWFTANLCILVSNDLFWRVTLQFLQYRFLILKGALSFVPFPSRID